MIFRTLYGIIDPASDGTDMRMPSGQVTRKRLVQRFRRWTNLQTSLGVVRDLTGVQWTKLTRSVCLGPVLCRREKDARVQFALPTSSAHVMNSCLVITAGRAGWRPHELAVCIPVHVTVYRRYIVVSLVEMVISTNQKPTIYRNLYENTDPGGAVAR